jgi:hypothetical protein
MSKVIGSKVATDNLNPMRRKLKTQRQSAAQRAERFRSSISLRFVVVGRRICGMKLVIVFHIHAQAGVWHKF